ncbi:GGDEF-domain containing protein [Arcobacter sp. CECT 8986]|uniref:bifunctional diguanylate cyclase/phosphodiesterase n=1 Tax=Arcobacter sp. CECT 8986 TaxID=2044507 RepID=UPI001009982F|nr:EAL domain-containing protein [Arcobacter sp. CECT 8986]RXK00221.1 GGDEF-domain containing protein [Arcobacter sp. CECT 8986]
MFFFTIYKVSKDEYKEYEVKQSNITKLTTTSINSVFAQYEMLMDVLIGQIKNISDTNKIENLLDYMLELNSSILVSGISNPNGTIYLSSSNSIKSKLYNLKTKKETKDTFIHTLNSDKMVIGRSYYVKSFDKVMIPMRKAIKDKNGKTTSIMTIGVDANKILNLLSNNEHRSYIFRGFDHFIQVINDSKKHGYLIYDKKISNKFIDYITNTAEKKYKVPIDILKNSNEVSNIFFKEYFSDDIVFASIQYIKRFDLYVVTQIKRKIIQDDIREQIFILIGTFIVIFVILFILFKYISENEEKKQKALYFQATHDHLTRLNNRKYLTTIFKKNELDEPFVMFFIDLDNFKSINDNYGHTYGDLVLKEVAFRLKNFQNKTDVLVRYSGDEFLLIKHNLTDDKIDEIAKQIITVISKTYFVDKYEFNIGSSIGISQYPNDSEILDDIKRYADISMYEAKKQKNSFRKFDEKVKQTYFRKSNIEYELKNALAKDEIYLVYQPQIDLHGNIYGVEALVRWENKELGFIPPDEFIKIAEATGQMIPLGRYIMQTALSEIKEVYENTGINFQLSINISVKQFMEREFFNKLFEYLKDKNFNKDLLTLEVTENVFIEDFKYILELFDRLIKRGIKISLDDFGTGYSSLNLLKRLPIDELKIDKSFVDDILDDEASKNMVQSIISIGKNFDMEILAEGIETIEQKQMLNSFGCDLFQGYYFSKPIKKEQLQEYILNLKKD